MLNLLPLVLRQGLLPVHWHHFLQHPEDHGRLRLTISCFNTEQKCSNVGRLLPAAVVVASQVLRKLL